MSRAASPERSPAVDKERRTSVASNHSRPSMEVDEAPAKRARTISRDEERARGKRMFGNILGTLQKFKKEDKSSRSSEAAKRREQVSERISSKIRTEATLQHEIQEIERELKSLRLNTESMEATLRHKIVALKARHTHLRPTSRFLHTSLPPSAIPVNEITLLNPAPIPLNQGPTQEPYHPKQLKPLYFLPKILLPEQETELKSRVANIDELITDESVAIDREKEKTNSTVTTNRARIEELSHKLAGLRKQVKPLEIRGRAAATDQTDDLGRQKREREPEEEESMDVEPSTEQQDKETERQRESEKDAGVQIRGENGDVEVEY